MTDSRAHSPENAAQPGPAEGRAGRRRMPVWLLRTILGVVAAAVLFIAYLIASATVPLTWANAIKNQVGPQLGNSIPLGMFYGFTFSFVPVLVAWQAHRRKLNKWVRVGILVLAVLLAIPNLLTLGVLHGTTGSARNALSIWNTGGANWFGAWSESFMVVGVVCAVADIVLGRLWLRRGRKIRQVKAAEKLVRENEARKARAAKDAARAAEKAARDAERSNRRGTGGTTEA
jgi:hypothetical protein